MAGKKAAISINLIADAAKAKAGFTEAEKAAGSLDKQFKNVAKTAAGAFGTATIVNFGKEAIGAASDLAESMNAVAVTFGDASDGILDLGKNAATAVGLSEREFNTFAVGLAGFTKQIANSDAEIVDLTDNLTVRIADFASVMNLDVPQAADKFRQALAGETEGMRQFGIDVSAAAVQTYALENGITDSAAAMTEAEKVQARYGLLMEQTEQMSGDFANTSDGLANSQRILAAELDNLKATVGEAMIPALEGLMGAVGPVLDAFTSLPEGVQQTTVLVGAAAIGFKSASTSLQGFGLAAKTANTALGVLGLALYAGTTVLNAYNTQKQEATQISEGFRQALDLEADGVDDATDSYIANQLTTGRLGEAIADLGLNVRDVTRFIRGEHNPALEELIDHHGAGSDIALIASDAFKDLNLSIKGNAADVVIAGREIRKLRDGLDTATTEAGRYDAAMTDAGAITGWFSGEISDLRDMFSVATTTGDEFEQAVYGINVETGKSTKTINGLTFELALLNSELSREELLLNLEERLARVDEQLAENEEGTLAYRQAVVDGEQAILDYIAAVDHIPPSMQTDIVLTYRDEGYQSAIDRLNTLVSGIAAIPSASDLLAGLTDQEFFAGLARHGIDPVEAGVNVPGLQSSTVIGGPPTPLSSTLINGGASTRGGVNVTVNAGMGTDGLQVGREIVEVLNAYAAGGGARLTPSLVGN